MREEEEEGGVGLRKEVVVGIARLVEEEGQAATQGPLQKEVVLHQQDVSLRQLLLNSNWKRMVERRRPS